MRKRQEKQHNKHQLTDLENANYYPAKILLTSQYDMSIDEPIDFYSGNNSYKDVGEDTWRPYISLSKLNAYTAGTEICKAVDPRKYLVEDVATTWYKSQSYLTEERPLNNEELLVQRIQSRFKKPIVKAESFKRISPQFLYLLQQHAEKVAKEDYTMNLIANLRNRIRNPMKTNTTPEKKCSIASIKSKTKPIYCSVYEMSNFVTESELHQCCQTLSKKQFVKRTCDQLQQANASSGLQLCCESILSKLINPEKTTEKKVSTKNSKKRQANTVTLPKCENINPKDNALKDSINHMLMDFFRRKLKRNRSKHHIYGGEDLKTKALNICVKKSLKPILKKTKSISKESKTLTCSKSANTTTNTVIRQSRATKCKSSSKRSHTPCSTSKLLREIWRRPEYRRDSSEGLGNTLKIQRKKRLFAGYDEKLDSIVSVVGCKTVVSLHELPEVKLTMKTSRTLGIAGDSNQNMKLKDKRVTKPTEKTPSKNNERYAYKQKTLLNAVKNSQKPIYNYHNNSYLDVQKSLHSQQICGSRPQQLKGSLFNIIYRNNRFESSLSSSLGTIDTEPSHFSEAYDVCKSCQLSKQTKKLIGECYSKLDGFCKNDSSVRQYSRCLGEHYGKRHYYTSDFSSSEDNLCFRQYTYYDKPKRNQCDIRDNMKRSANCTKTYSDPSRKGHQLCAKTKIHTSESSIISTDYDYKYRIKPTNARYNTKQSNMKRRERNKYSERSETLRPSRFNKLPEDSKFELKREKQNKGQKLLNIQYNRSKNYDAGEPKPKKKSENSLRLQETHWKSTHAPYYAKQPSEVKSRLSNEMLLKKNYRVPKVSGKAESSVKPSESFKREISNILERKLVMVVDASTKGHPPKKLQKKVTINEHRNTNLGKYVTSKDAKNLSSHSTDSGKLIAGPKTFTKSESKRKQSKRKPTNKF